MQKKISSLEKIKISAVSYLNTTSFMFGIENSKRLSETIDLQKDIPAECARKLLEGEVDLGLIPVAMIPKLETAHIISDYCIGAVGKVKSVLLLSDVPLNKIETIFLDYQSRTSVALCQVLCRELWKINPQFESTKAGFEEQISGKNAGVIIGDRTFHLNKEYSYQFDLAEEWQKLTGLPFVFAAWVSNKPLSKNFIEEFNQALKFGLENTQKAIETLKNPSISKHELFEYLTRYIQFDLDAEKRKGLNLFLNKLKS